MATRVRVQMRSKGSRDLLRSEGVRALLVARAQRVKAAADAELATLDEPYPRVRVIGDLGTGRAGVSITGVPLPLEQSRRILGGAIDAAG